MLFQGVCDLKYLKGYPSIAICVASQLFFDLESAIALERRKGYFTIIRDKYSQHLEHVSHPDHWSIK